MSLLRTMVCTLEWDSAQEDLLMRIYSLTTVQCKDKLMSKVQVHSVQPVPSTLFLPKEDTKELERHQWPRSAANTFLQASSKQWPQAAPAEKKNQNNRTTARYSFSREDESSSTASGTNSPTVPENAGWLREDGAWRPSKWPRQLSTAVSQDL